MQKLISGNWNGTWRGRNESKIVKAKRWDLLYELQNSHMGVKLGQYDGASLAENDARSGLRRMQGRRDYDFAAAEQVSIERKGSGPDQGNRNRCNHHSKRKQFGVTQVAHRPWQPS